MFCLPDEHSAPMILNVVGMESPAQPPIGLMTPTGFVW